MRKHDFPKVTPEVQQLSCGTCVFEISLKPWKLCKIWRIFFFLDLWWTKNSLIVFKIISVWLETQYEKIDPMSGKWLDSWNEFSKNDGDMMFMRWNDLILIDMTYLMAYLLKCLISIENPSSLGVTCYFVTMTFDCPYRSITTYIMFP